uniref:Transport permease protein n=2 Tax=Vibrio nigripulchritudo TaxID=28173 RepID=A0A9P1NK90_9VIBR|nr:Putative ABC-type multidrug transport system, permease component [Vibrio nigripulchritudo]
MNYFNVFWLTMKATYFKKLRENVRAFPLHFFFGRMMTGIYTCLFGYFLYTYMFAKSTSLKFQSIIGSGDFLTYYTLGAILLVVVVSTTMNISREIILELRQGTFESLLLTPSSRLGYLLGITFEQLLRTLLEVIPSILLSIYLGAKFSNVSTVNLFLAYLTLLVTLFSLSLMVASIMLASRDTYLTQNTVFAIIGLTTGISFPISYLPDWIQLISNAIPITNAVDIIRSVVEGNSFLVSFNECWKHLLILNLIYGLAGYFLVKYTEQYLFEVAEG